MNIQTSPKNEKPEFRDSFVKRQVATEKSSKHEKVLSSLRIAVDFHLPQCSFYDPLEKYPLLLFLSKYSEVLVNSCILSTK